jgi:hypothetical protein
MINIHYQKRKNGELFKSLENQDSLFLSKTQNYIPIYKRFFELNEKNYNNINLNHSGYLLKVHENKEDNVNKNLFECEIQNVKTENIKQKSIFFKLAPLLDPFKYLVGKYDINDKKLFQLPTIHSNENNCISKMLDWNNSAYVDGFFLFLTNQLLYEHSFIHGIEYYGSFLAIKNNFKINVFDDLEYLCNSEFFNKNKNVLFTIDPYDETIFHNDTSSGDTKLKPLHIDYNTNAKSNLSIKSLDYELFEGVFCIEEKTNQKTMIQEELIDMNKTNLLTGSNDKDLKTTTLKSDSSCSSRTSCTSEECSDCDEDSEDSEYTEDGELDKSICEDEWEDIDEESEEESEEEIDEEEKIEVTIQQFPVQVISMEYCENTFDDLILNNDLSEEEWFSALMQIIMILITYQKCFQFTHNDLHTNNVMYNSTKKKFIFYKYKNIIYKVPTFGRIFKIIDFGRSIYKLQGNLFCSDSFQVGGDAATQYNIEPYFNKDKPRLDPNYSFDLCRLACSIFDYLVEDMDEIKDLDKCESVTRIIVEWCLDDKGVNMLYKNNGTDRYPDFKLYKMIARHVHHHTPQAQLEREEFKRFIVKDESSMDKGEKIIDIDKIPIFA